SWRAESFSMPDDGDATIRQGNGRSLGPDEGTLKPHNSRTCTTLKLILRPPKLAPSAWQLYFSEWIQRHKASSSQKINVAQAVKVA
ncbi:hypothetical protein FB451DRAFT_1000642, partial [Mycena latifolia]